MKPNIIYLHGFASSPGSRKAQAFKGGFEQYEIHLQIPDLNQPSFDRLTLTTMLAYLAMVVQACPPGPVYLVGSSLGGLVAVHFVNSYKDAEARRVELLFLMAPALDFVENRRQALGEDGMAAWERSGWLSVYNYAAQADRRVHYGLIKDLEDYDTFGAHVEIPVMIYHGSADTSVPLADSERFAADRANVQLRVVDGDHTLLGHIDDIWKDMVNFFAL